MPVMDTRPFVAPDNTTILNAIRNTATPAYQARIPAADKADIQNTLRNLLNNRPSMNEFVDALVNRIGLEIFKNTIWTNPLAKYKRGMLEYGDTIEEIMVGLLQAKRYDPDRQQLEKDIFGVEKPNVQVSYHKVNRQDYYKLSVNEAMLKRAFLTEFGLSNFVTSLMNTPATSDQWDEFLLTTSLLGEYYRDGGFFKVNVPDLGAVGSTGADARYGLRRIREFSDTLPFISANYNAAGMPVAATRDELELIITPNAMAALDVEALAGAFNVNKADIGSRTTVVPNEYWGIPGAQAILTTRDFFVIADQRIETQAAINPVGLHTNYFLHHHQVVSASRFEPAILFTTEPGDVITVIATPVTSISTPEIRNAAGTVVTSVSRGDLFNVYADGVTTPTDAANDAIRFAISGNVTLSPRTYITQTGMLHVSPDENATTITITFTATDSGSDTVGQLTTTLAVPVIGPKLTLWPNANVAEDADADGLFERTPKPLTMSADFKVTIPFSDGVKYQKSGADVLPGTVHTISGTVPFTAQATAGNELATGAVATWSFTH